MFEERMGERMEGQGFRKADEKQVVRRMKMAGSWTQGDLLYHEMRYLGQKVIGIPNRIRAKTRESLSVAELTNAKLASASPKRYSSSVALGGETVMFIIGEPTRGMNSRLPECSCHMTRTDSSPPLSKYAPLVVKATEETA